MNTAPFYGSLRACLTVAILLGLHGFLRAEDESPAKAGPPKAAASTDDEASKSKKGEAAEKKADSPKEPSLLDKLSKELLKEIDDDPDKPKPEQEEDKFERVAKGMRSASEKLDGKETGDETTRIQEQVIRDLEDLIKQLQNPPPDGGGGGGGGSSSNSGGAGGGRQQRTDGRGGTGQGQPQRGAPKQQAQGQGGEQGVQDRQNADGSDKRTDAERKAAETAARAKKLAIDVWGHLPPHMRDELLNTYGERMLPKYEQLVRQFYEALSEQNNSAPPRR